MSLKPQAIETGWRGYMERPRTFDDLAFALHEKDLHPLAAQRLISIILAPDPRNLGFYTNLIGGGKDSMLFAAYGTAYWRRDLDGEQSTMAAEIIVQNLQTIDAKREKN